MSDGPSAGGIEPVDRDERAMVAAAQTDPRAFAPLYRTYVGPVFAYCRQRLDDREMAEDVTARVFMQALSGLPGFRGGSFRAWLFTIAQNEVNRTFRSRRPVPIDAAIDVVDPTPSPEETMLATEAIDELRSLLSLLTPDQRNVVELRLAGLSGSEIAQVLGRSRGSVDVAQCRAVARLKSAVDTKRQKSHAS